MLIKNYKDYIEINNLLQLEQLNQSKKRINNFLQELVNKVFSNSNKVLDAIKYSLLSDGKRVRAALVYAVGEYLEIKTLDKLNAVAASLEIIHCYSLIHDDLPAMDNDDLRRGKPSCHIAFDEATAILAGDALQGLAFQVLADPDINNYDSIARSNIVLELAKAIGLSGMVLGQAQDMAYEKLNHSDINLKLLEEMHSYKTGALFNALISMVILVAGNNNLDIKQQLLTYSYHLGLMFQIKDDILDFEQPTEMLGKSNKADYNRKKATFVTILGLDGAKEQLELHYNNAVLALNNLQLINNNASIVLLQQFVDYFKNRKN